MDNILDQIEQIRELIYEFDRHDQLLDNTVKWIKLCASIDVIRDNQYAIDCYFQLAPFDSSNGGHLYIYGVLQAFFVQQDAVFSLIEALDYPKVNLREDYEELYEVREVRNNAIGHPSKRGNDQSFHFLSFPDLSNSGFKLLSHITDENEKKMVSYQMLELKNKQQENIRKILGDVIKRLKDETKPCSEKSENICNYPQ